MGCPIPPYVFSHVLVRCHKCLIFMTWKNTGHLAFRSEFCGTTGRRFLKAIKQRLPQRRIASPLHIHVSSICVYPSVLAFLTAWNQTLCCSFRCSEALTQQKWMNCYLTRRVGLNIDKAAGNWRGPSWFGRVFNIDWFYYGFFFFFIIISSSSSTSTAQRRRLFEQ